MPFRNDPFLSRADDGVNIRMLFRQLDPGRLVLNDDPMEMMRVTPAVGRALSDGAELVVFEVGLRVDEHVQIKDASRLFLPDQFEDVLISRKVSERVEVGVVLDPSLQLRSAAWERTFQQVESLVDIPQFRVATRDIIQSVNIVRVDGQRSGNPFPGTLLFAELDECRDSQMGGPRILWVTLKFTLGEVDAFAGGIFRILITTE